MPDDRLKAGGTRVVAFWEWWRQLSLRPAIRTSCRKVAVLAIIHVTRDYLILGLLAEDEHRGGPLSSNLETWREAGARAIVILTAPPSGVSVDARNVAS